MRHRAAAAWAGGLVRCFGKGPEKETDPAVAVLATVFVNGHDSFFEILNTLLINIQCDDTIAEICKTGGIVNAYEATLP